MPVRELPCIWLTQSCRFLFSLLSIFNFDFRFAHFLWYFSCSQLCFVLWFSWLLLHFWSCLVTILISLHPKYRMYSEGTIINPKLYFLHLSSVQFSRSVVSDSLWPHESQHARPPCPSPTPGVHSESRLSSQWCHPAISSSVVSFSSYPQSLPASQSFPMSQLFAWCGQITGVSALASFLPKKSRGWSPSEWTGWISVSYYKILSVVPCTIQ